MQTLFPTLFSERLILRKLEDNDKMKYFTIFSNSDVVKYYGCPLLKEISEVDEHFARFQKSYDDGRLINWAIELRDTKEYVGNIELFGINKYHQKAVVGCAIIPQYWHHQIGYESTLIVMKYFFKDLSLNRLEAYIDVNNFAAIHYIKKTGFSQEGFLRDYEFENGHFINVISFSMLKKEYNCFFTQVKQ